MGRRGHIEMGIPAAVVAVLLVIAVVGGGDGFPPWARIALIAASVVFGGIALLAMATPRWPNVVLDDTVAPPPSDPPRSDPPPHDPEAA